MPLFEEFWVSFAKFIYSKRHYTPLVRRLTTPKIERKLTVVDFLKSCGGIEFQNNQEKGGMRIT